MSGDKIPDLDSSGKFVRHSSGNKVYKTETELTRALLDNEITHELYVELLEVYHVAYGDAPEYGFVGVGCISFAESMLQYHQDGVERRIRIPRLYTDEDFNKENEE